MATRIGVYICALLTLLSGVLSIGFARVACDARRFGYFEWPILLLGWPISVLFASLVVFGCWWLRRRWVEMRWTEFEQAGQCGRCGYDVRDIARCCPECGFPVNEFLAKRNSEHV